MSVTGGLLDSEEVDFLLGKRAEAGSGDDRHAPVGDREVTMRGDLDKINLSDIFQTLAISKMEGLLVVRHPLEQRELYFRDGAVRCLVPARTETLRLGQRLVYGGFLTADELRTALLHQKKTHQPLGAALIELQLVSTEEVEEVLANQLEEELFGLFAWRRGSFEFYRGEVEEAGLRKRIERTPEFDVNGVLLEVARRADEWERILEHLRTLDEILVATDKPADELDEPKAAVLAAVDGIRNIRDVTDATLLGLFETARLLRELVEGDYVELLPFDAGVEVAQGLIQRGESRRAALALRTLLERDTLPDLDGIQRAAGVLRSCCPPQEAGRVLLAVVGRLSDPEEQLEVVRCARSLDRRSVELQRRHLELLDTFGVPDPDELTALLGDLADRLSDDGDYEEALAAVDRLEYLGDDPVSCRVRRARLLVRMERTDEAVETLLELAEGFRAEGDRERLAATYEQILKIDYRRRDVAKALKRLHTNRLHRQIKLAVIGLALLGAAWVAWLQLQALRRHEDLQRIATQVEQAIAEQRIEDAETLVAEAHARHGEAEPEALEKLHAVVRAAVHARLAERHEKQQAERVARLQRAADALDEGQLDDALELWQSLAEVGVSDAEIASVARGRLEQVQSRLETTSRQLAERLPPPPSLKQTMAEREATLALLERDLGSPDAEFVRSVARHASDPRLRAFLGDSCDAFVEDFRRISAVYATANRIADLYRDKRDRARVADELTPLFEAAQAHERAYRFSAARDAYATLASRHPEDDGLKRRFEELAERYAGILRHLTVLDEATRNGDFSTAQGALRMLKQQHPDIPFEQLTRLPLRVETVPPGATVRLEGEAVGTAPLVTSYRPDGETVVRIELDGFLPEETVLEGDLYGHVQSLLARSPAWSASTPATVDRALVTDDSGRLFAADRAGDVVAFTLADGTELWRRSTGDLSGLLSRPALLGGDHLVVASVDGPLRCLSRADGRIVWRIDDLPAESGPVGIGPVLIVATLDGRLLGRNAADGSPRFELPIDGPVHADLVTDGRIVLVTTATGTAYAVRRDGTEVWHARIGRGALTAPAIAGDTLVFLSDEGRVTALRESDGKVVWERSGFLRLVLAPVVVGQRVFFAEDRTLHCLDLATGRSLPGHTGEAVFCSHLAAGRSLVYAGDSTGVVWALGVEDLTPRFLLRAGGPALAPVSELPDGTVLAAFQDRTIRAFHR